MVEEPTLRPPPSSAIIHRPPQPSSEDREVQPGPDLERGVVMSQPRALDERMRVATARLEPEQQVPAVVVGRHAARRGTLVVDSTTHVERGPIPRRQAELQVTA